MLNELEIISYSEDNDAYYIKVKPKQITTICPKCNCHTAINHSRYIRKVQDISINKKKTYLKIQCQRVQCINCNHVYNTKFKEIREKGRITERLRMNLAYECTIIDNKSLVARTNGLTESFLRKLVKEIIVTI